MGSKKIRRAVAAVLVLSGSLALLAAQSGEALKPLVRKDLLVFGRGEIAPPVRDIFRPKAAAAPGGARPAGPKVKPVAGPAVPDAPPGFDLNISYVGSVESGGEMIALVLRGGQTLSVKRGEDIAPGYKVIGLTADAIVVQGPTGETRTFQKQGDRP